MNDILQAARSYYGLADTESCTTQLYTNQAGQPCVAFEIALSNEDFADIVQRMQNMQQPDTQPDAAIIEGPTVVDMRKLWVKFSKEEKAFYGYSFKRFLGEGPEQDGINSRQVIHVDAPEEPEPVSMDAVWLTTYEATEAQKMHCIETGNRVTDGALVYSVQWAMLTDEQKQKAKEAKP